MQTKSIYLNKHVAGVKLIHSKLSLKPVFNFIKTKTAFEENIKLKFYRFILIRFAMQLKRAHAASNSELQRNTNILELMYAELSPIVYDKKHYLSAIQEIRNALLYRPAYDEKLYTQVIQSLQTLIGNNEIAFGLMPFVRINGKLEIDLGVSLQSSLSKSAYQSVARSEVVFESFINELSKQPRVLIFPSITEPDKHQYPFLRSIAKEGIRSYGMIPVFYQQRFVGVIEVYSRIEHCISKRVLSVIDITIPLLAQMLHNTVEIFNTKINRVVGEKFVALQPSVQWKFNEMAWEYLKRKAAGATDAKVGKVIFRDVYPLYGAIDIRNSTIEQNLALQQDMTNMIHRVQEALAALSTYVPAIEITPLFEKATHWLTKASTAKGKWNEIQFQQFLEGEVRPLLMTYRNRIPKTNEAVTQCLEYTGDGCSGPAYSNRRQLEESIQLVNNTISGYLKEARQELESIFPSYFEAFRTDGIEYDIYIGQAIAPDQLFNEAILQAVRVWQIQTMAHIARLTHELKSQLQRPLQTTQLIFVHGTPIDINFRNDERRFDVEGAYNIRYEVIKKRIDKVLLQDKSHRLTQPGKIAFVFYNVPQQKKYEAYIRHFQEEQLLKNDLEFLELDELQGVSGLKALRVGVKME